MMTNPPKFYFRILLAFLMLIGMWGCAHKSFDPPETGEIPKGPGVFTKSDDGVVLFDSTKTKAQGDAKMPAAYPVDPSADARISDEEYEEFEAYRQWLEWKKSNAGKDEYQEFKQWQEWRRYQDWKKKK